MVISRESPGTIRNLRYKVISLLLPFYMILPWIHVNGKPIIRLDIPERKFYLLGEIFIPQEGYFLWLFLITAGISLFFFTSLIGRVWCGWACPQTVFTEVFDNLGRFLISTDYGKKDAPKSSKIKLYVGWLIASSFFSFAWVAYFSDPYIMLNDISNQQFSGSNWPYFLGFFTTTLFLDMTVVREQFCKYACPYARFQTVMMDMHSINVTYDFNRGEPRRVKQTKIGDCIDCKLCTIVCPTGIDIREGVQVGCIACGKCVDACTKIMAKEDKKTLIGYFTQEQVESKTKEIQWIRPRVMIYGTLLICLSISTLFLLYKRVPLYTSLQPDKNIRPYIDQNLMVRNFYDLHLQNLTWNDKIYQVSLETDTSQTDRVKLLVSSEEGGIQIPANSSEKMRIIAEVFPDKKSQYPSSLTLKVQDSINPKIWKIIKVPFSKP
jgi:cytochrome c oxidase accessory protein FixG